MFKSSSNNKKKMFGGNLQESMNDIKAVSKLTQSLTRSTSFSTGYDRLQTKTKIPGLAPALLVMVEGDLRGRFSFLNSEETKFRNFPVRP